MVNYSEYYNIWALVAYISNYYHILQMQSEKIYPVIWSVHWKYGKSQPNKRKNNVSAAMGRALVTKSRF